MWITVNTNTLEKTQLKDLNLLFFYTNMHSWYIYTRNANKFRKGACFTSEMWPVSPRYRV